MNAILEKPPYTKPIGDYLEGSLKATEILHPKSAYAAKYDGLLEVKRNRVKKEKEQRPLFFFIGLSLSLLLITIAFNWKSYDDSGLIDLGQIEDDFDEVMEVPVSTQPPPPPPKQQEILNIQVVDDQEIIEEVEINLDVELTEDMAVDDVVYIPEPEIEEEQAEQIFQIVEDHPSFPGGIRNFYEYVSESIVYPNLARRLDISGRVFVQFVIEKDGTPSQVKVVKGIGAGCDEEAIRVIENSPKWIPGKQRGKPVRVYMTVPINFTLIAGQ